MAKQILSGFEGVKALERGVDAVANAVNAAIVYSQSLVGGAQ